jgi:hypothetical protein
MQVPSLNQLFVFRIEHKDNLPYILEHGMHTSGHGQLNPNHIFIGNAKITADRHSRPVRPIDISPEQAQHYGNLGDYVPFYFGPRSPMLGAIMLGTEGVLQRPQKEIVYLCCRFRTVLEAGWQYAFTDGQAKMTITAFYHNPDSLNKLHWDTIYARQWFNTSEEFDRRRRKQAELLVHSHVPPSWIEAIVVYDDDVRTFAHVVVDRLNHPAVIRVNPSTPKLNNCGFYYP